MLKKCVICGKSVEKWVVNPKHPSKPVCLDCLKGIALDEKNIETELAPFVAAVSKGIEALKDELDKKQV
jgi:hypothetical protein